MASLMVLEMVRYNFVNGSKRMVNLVRPPGKSSQERKTGMAVGFARKSIAALLAVGTELTRRMMCTPGLDTFT